MKSKEILDAEDVPTAPCSICGEAVTYGQRELGDIPAICIFCTDLSF